jgi:hypothetical protein
MVGDREAGYCAVRLKKEEAEMPNQIEGQCGKLHLFQILLFFAF